jgi:uncharacterized damage-inducible protein DinB
MTNAADGPTFTAYWRGVRKRTVRLLPLVPDERWDWSPGSGRWTFADQFRHLAGIERWMYAENAEGRPSRYPGHGPELAEGGAAIGELTERWHEEACCVFESLSAARMAAKTMTPAGFPITTFKWLRAMIEHEAHHRGQLYLMLGLVGVEPPQLYGLTEEEVRRRSAGAAATDPS